MNDTQKAILLKVAKDAIVAAVTNQQLITSVIDDSELNAHCGCFVTIKNNGRLRGCIGQFISDKPLVELVRDMATASATNDPRFVFEPIRPKEFDRLDIEISVLSPLKKTDNPLSLRLGIDGIYIVKGCNSGCFLPQVATETGWSREEFLSYCCEHKAGLEPDAWQDPSTEVYFFTADVFGKNFRDI